MMSFNIKERPSCIEILSNPFFDDVRKDKRYRINTLRDFNMFNVITINSKLLSNNIILVVITELSNKIYSYNKDLEIKDNDLKKVSTFIAWKLVKGKYPTKANRSLLDNELKICVNMNYNFFNL